MAADPGEKTQCLKMDGEAEKTGDTQSWCGWSYGDCNGLSQSRKR